ncbi:hypothetical protein GEMRC1_006015 [Eukaryota sp. GEM-RC1]
MSVSLSIDSPTDLLASHHKLITDVLESFEEFILSQFDSTDAGLFARFFSDYADKYHHAMEEDLIFDLALSKHIATEPIKAMLKEHTALRALISSMRECLSHDGSSEFKAFAEKYIDLLKNHAYKEDNILAPMLEEGFSEFDVLSLMKKISSVKLNDELLSIADQLNDKYAAPKLPSCPGIRDAGLSQNSSTSTLNLQEEHRKISAVLSALVSFCRHSLNTAFDTTTANSFVQFFTGFADRVHHAKEENILFVFAKDTGFPVKGGPIEVMELEHEINRELMTSMKEAIEAEDVVGFSESSNEYASHLTQHIYKEDQILFKLLDAHFPPSVHSEIAKRFESAELEMASETEELMQVMNELVSKFPSEAVELEVELSCQGCTRQLECGGSC